MTTDPRLQAAATMRGFPPPREHRVTLENWDSPPFNRWSFRNVRRFLPTAEVPRGAAVNDLPRRSRAIEAIAFEDLEGERTTVGALLERTFTDGFIVLHRGRIVAERYYNGMTERSLHLSQSVGKSVVASIAGILIGRGSLDPDAVTADYVPELGRTAYGDATLQHVLDMRSGVKFTEVYTDPSSDVHKIDSANGWKPRRPDVPECTYELILTLEEKAREHGGVFDYRSIETEVLGWCIERATGTALAELVSGELWAKLGAEQDAYFTVDSAGAVTASGGFNATLRDYARFGQLYLDAGFANGRQIVPAEWVEACRTGDHSVFYAPYTDTLPEGAYRNQFWIEDARERAIMARGVFGQLVYISPALELVGVKLSTWPDFQNVRFNVDTLRALHAIGEALS